MDRRGTLFLLRGVSGAGKTTLANTLSESLGDSIAFAADDFWGGEYDFEMSRLNEAHQWCQGQAEKAMKYGMSNVIVHNTLASSKELSPYLYLAEKHNYKVVSLIVENRHGNSSVHNVPKTALDRQRNKLMNSIKL